jgi:hypothetical protein
MLNPPRGAHIGEGLSGHPHQTSPTEVATEPHLQFITSRRTSFTSYKTTNDNDFSARLEIFVHQGIPGQVDQQFGLKPSYVICECHGNTLIPLLHCPILIRLCIWGPNCNICTPPCTRIPKMCIDDSKQLKL